MNVLSIDTTGVVISLGLVYAENFYERSVEIGFYHAQQLLPTIEAFLGDLEIKKPRIDLIVCLSGPGSFTGLRVGVATARGLAMAWNCPLVLISSLLVYGQEDSKRIYLTCIDARKGRFYVALYQNGVCLTPEMDATPEEILEKVEKYQEVWVTGPGATVLSASIELPENIKIDQDPYRSRARYALELGMRQFLADGAVLDHEGPNYLRLSDAEIMGPNQRH